MRIVHLGTTIEARFGVMDDDGNVSPQDPLTLTLPVFSLEQFQEAHDLVCEQREKWANQAEETGPDA